MTPLRPSPTLQDVAKMAGVSTATVSRCLNTPDKVIAITRDRVDAAVRALGYAPNFGARAMASRRTNTVAAIIPTMENAIFAKGLQAFQEALRDLGYTLLVASSSYDPAIEADQIRTLISRGADGLLLIGHDRDRDIYDLLHRQNVPVVVAWTYASDPDLVSVGFDNSRAMQSLGARILALGHKRLAFVAPAIANNDRARGRLEGLRRAMAMASLDPAHLTIIETPYGIENGRHAFGALMSGGARPTAIICGNDVLAVGAMLAAREMGIDVPGDVSITGFDDIELARVASPPLTTVTVPHQDMGRRAAAMLVDMVRSGQPGKTVKLHTTIRDGATLAPPASP